MSQNFSRDSWILHRESANIGDRSRRTGLTLKEGRRDEHGMEEVDGIFSSPEKSPAKLNGFGNEGTDNSIGSDGMSMDEGALAVLPLQYSHMGC